MLQVYAKEEELCELQVKLSERENALKAYKTENSRFADMKDKFKADISSLQQQVNRTPGCLPVTNAVVGCILDFLKLMMCIEQAPFQKLSSIVVCLQVVEKEEEKATLLTMCNELMNKLEREGISL